uniref:melanopsin-like n=1 Tax=Myxine glutinosa TaxID=7769 RepID=UPI00358DEB40
MDKFPMLDVPSQVHYIIGAVVLIIGIIGCIGNAVVMFAFCRSKELRTPANMLIVNLAFSDFMMSITQAPPFFVTSLLKRWIFGDKGCEVYGFCGAVFGISSMITLTAVSIDRYHVITHPLASIGRALTKRKASAAVLFVWMFSIGWSLPPFFGWSSYVPEGLMTSCTWDYMTFTPLVRTYTMLLFCFVFFIPLLIIIVCYVRIFIAIKRTNREVQTLGSSKRGETRQADKRLKGEWRLAKIALIIILLFVISWSPYSCVALIAWAGYANLLTPYTNSIPAIIAKASAIHNPIVYAITHPKYRQALGKHVPCLRKLLVIQHAAGRVSQRSVSHSTYTSCNDHSFAPKNTSISISKSELATIGYLPIVDATQTELNTVNTVLHRSVDAANSLHLDAIVVVVDQALYAKAQFIIWQTPVFTEKIVSWLGAFQTAMTFLACIGKRFGDGGLEDILIQYEVLAPGSVNGVMNRKHYNRSLSCNKLLVEASHHLLWQNFLQTRTEDDVNHYMAIIMQLHASFPSKEYTDTVDGADFRSMLETYSKFVEEKKKANATFAFWCTYIEMMETLLQFIRSS